MANRKGGDVPLFSSSFPPAFSIRLKHMNLYLGKNIDKWFGELDKLIYLELRN